MATTAITNDWAEVDVSISGGKEWFKLFQFSKTLNSTKCIKCEKLYSGCLKQNLKRHLCKKHSPEAEKFNVRIKHKADDNTRSDCIAKKFKDGKLTLGEYIRNCVLLAAINMTSFLLFNSPFFRSLTLVHAMKFDFVINSDNIRHFIKLTASAIRKLIANEIRNKLISIKIDIATRHYRSVLGLNVQFYCSVRRRITIRTLGCIELNRSHTSAYLEKKVYDILALYDIDRKNIYSFTSDNGANMLCLGKLIQKMQDSLLLTQQCEQLKDQTSFTTESDDEEFGVEEDVEFEFDYQQDKHAEVDSQTIDDLMKSLNTDMDDSSHTTFMVVFGCAAHTIQLAVHDVLKQITRTSIKHIRGVIKELRSSKYLNYNIPGLKSLKLNVCSRWNSLYKMFTSILKHQDKLHQLFSRVPIADLHDIQLTKTDFEYMEKFNEAFKPIYEMTLALQSEQLAMSDIIVLWYRCKVEINKLDKEDNEFVPFLIEAFDRRTDQLMSNELLATAAYIDPRLNHKKRSAEFMGDLTEVAEQRILYVLKRIKANQSASSQSDSSQSESSQPEAIDEIEDEIEQCIERETSTKALQVRELASDHKHLLGQIRNLANQNKISMKSDIFGHYNDLKKRGLIDDDLYEAVMVVLSAPATQVSVERAFSALAILLDKKRCNLKGCTIDDVLTVTLNRDLTNLVNFDSMKA